MIGFEGRLQWRRQILFKLHAKPPHRKKYRIYKKLGVSPRSLPNRGPHPKFAIRSFLVRRTKNEHAPEWMLSGVPVPTVSGCGAAPSPASLGNCNHQARGTRHLFAIGERRIGPSFKPENEVLLARHDLRRNELHMCNCTNVRRFFRNRHPHRAKLHVKSRAISRSLADFAVGMSIAWL